MKTLISNGVKKNNIFVIAVAVLILVAFGLMYYSGGKNKVATPAVDPHGHSLPQAVNTSAASLGELADKPAPEFTLADRDGKRYSLKELRGKNIVLFFNEGIMCYPACWNQIVSLARDERFKNSETAVLSVVVDSPKDWQNAIKKMPELAEATVVFDKDAAVSKRYDMLTAASSMHYGSFPGHTYVVIDKEGVIRYVFDDPAMGIRNDQLAVEVAKLNTN